MKNDALIKRLEGRLEEAAQLPNKDEALTVIATRFLDMLLKNGRLAKFFFERAQYQESLVRDDKVKRLFEKSSATIRKAMRRIVKDCPVISLSKALSKKYPEPNLQKTFQQASWAENVKALLNGYVFVRYEPAGKTFKDRFQKNLSYMVGPSGNQSMINAYKSRISFIGTILGAIKKDAELVDDVTRILKTGDPLPEFQEIFQTIPMQRRCRDYRDLAFLYQEYYPKAKRCVLGYFDRSVPVSSWNQKAEYVLKDVADYLHESTPDKAGKCEFSKPYRTLSHGKSTYRFNDSNNSTFKLFSMLWDRRSRGSQIKGELLQNSMVAVQMGLVVNVREYDYKPLAQKQVKNAIDGIRRILRRKDLDGVKMFPLNLATSKGLQLEEDVSATR